VLVYTDHGDTSLSGYSVAVQLAEIAESIKPFPAGVDAPGPPLMGNRVVLPARNLSLLWTLFWIAVGWSTVAVASTLYLTVRARPGTPAWAAAGLVAGPLSVLGFAGRTGRPLPVALGDGVLAVIGPFAGLVVATIAFGAFDLRAVVVGLVVGWLLVRVPLSLQRSGRTIRRTVLESAPVEFISAGWAWAGMIVVADVLGVAYLEQFGLEAEFGSLPSILIAVGAALAGSLTTIPAQLWLGRHRLTPLTQSPDSAPPTWPARVGALLLTLAALAGAIAAALAT
jgi:hypothetical protein